MEKLDIPPIPEFIEMIHDAGRLARRLQSHSRRFRLKAEDFCFTGEQGPDRRRNPRTFRLAGRLSSPEHPLTKPIHPTFMPSVPGHTTSRTCLVSIELIDNQNSDTRDEGCKSYHEFLPRFPNISQSTRHLRAARAVHGPPGGDRPERSGRRRRMHLFVLTRRGTAGGMTTLSLLLPTCDVRQECSTPLRTISRWRKNARKSLSLSRRPCRCTTSSVAKCRHWQGTKIRRARCYW